MIVLGIPLIPSFLGFMVMAAGGFFDPFAFFSGDAVSQFELISGIYIVINPISKLIPFEDWLVNTNRLVYMVQAIISMALLNFVIGALLGSLYGKFKNRKSLPSSNF
ncbi:MAG: hypothetical protein A2W65_01810 [Candidatus Taylorbacteria bacterium RIFCSPLOWO2_02_50_13]|nr:MAG: hypothetical protein A2W65_01810 [Candidatus Taylorbacteria bacterium RIFCSPLOWO2_02_50_13]HCB35217.1 hypothetical protein [Candidatus Taylorbacteria bacterium]